MKPRILQLTPGPVFEIKFKYYEELSKFFWGFILTSSKKLDVMSVSQVGEFSWNCLKTTIKNKQLHNIVYFLWAVYYCAKLRFQKTKVDLVVTYDPLKTGLIGLLCAFILKAKFAPEVNGVYTSPAAFIDEPDNVSTKLKRMVYPLIESFVKQIYGKVIRSFPCQVDIDPFLNYKDSEEKKEVLFVGYPYKLKGVDILIAAFKMVAGEYPDWRLKILGWFADQTQLKNAIDGHPQIEIHPPVYFSEMPDHICKCGIFVLPSRTEAMGRVLVEAMAAGKPRIGSNVDGIPTVIDDGIDGLLFESENSKDLAHKMVVLMDDKQLREKMGLAGKIRAQKEFQNAVFLDNLKKYYTAII
jgi:glycosyltransferase involved in cell wall biosynthesis